MPAQYKPEQYKAIRAWGAMMGSFSNYIKNEQQRASQQDAPLTAIYDQGNGDWATIPGIKSIDTVITLAIYLASK